MTPPTPGDGDGLTPGEGAGEVDGSGEADGPGDADGARDDDGSGDDDAPGVTDGPGEVDGPTETLGPGETLAPGVPDAPGEPLGAGVGIGLGPGRRPICSVLMRTYSRSPAVVMATEPGSPSSAITSSTSLGGGVPSRKWISHTVPPVKSIENLRPAFPSLNGVRAMKMRPGIMIRRLKA